MHYVQENRVYIMAALELSEISFHNVEDAAEGAELPGDKKKAGLAVPGKPSFSIFTGK